MISVKNLKKSFDNNPILKGISCDFEKGKTSLIIGQTGSGKTVFLKCLLGLHKYEEGEIIFDNNNLIVHSLIVYYTYPSRRAAWGE